MTAARSSPSRGCQHVPVPVEPFPDLEAQVPLHQRRGLLPAEIVGERDPDAAKLQHVAEALGGDEGGASPPALQDRVGGDGGRVHDLGHRPGRRRFRPGSGPAREVGSDTLGDRPRVVVRRGRHLQPVQPAVAAREDEVGECPADVDAKPKDQGPGLHEVNRIVPGSNHPNSLFYAPVPSTSAELHVPGNDARTGLGIMRLSAPSACGTETGVIIAPRPTFKS